MAWPGRFKFFQKHDDYEEAVQACKLARSEMEEAVVELKMQPILSATSRTAPRISIRTAGRR